MPKTEALSPASQKTLSDAPGVQARINGNSTRLRRQPVVVASPTTLSAVPAIADAAELFDADSEIRPRDIHALWLLLRDRHEFASSVLDEIAQGIFGYATGRDMKRLLSIAMRIGIVDSSSTEISAGVETLWSVNTFGHEFAKCDHWRYWRAPMEIAPFLAQTGISQWFIREKHRRAVIDLFSGAGGLGLGFEMAGFHVKVAVDNDPQACEAHLKNFPLCEVVEGDIDEIAKNPTSELCERFGLEKTDIAGIVGGPPCQGFSYMGERAVHDERNLLTSRFMDIVLDIEPDFFVMENVQGLVTGGNPPEFHDYITRLAKSIGEPANKLVDALPPPARAVAKRKRQYLKRLISGIIEQLQLWVDEKVGELDDTASLPPMVDMAAEYFYNGLVERIKVSYPSDEETYEAINSLENRYDEVIKVALGAVAIAGIKYRLISKTRCREFVDMVAKVDARDDRTRELVAQLISEYSQVPKGAKHRGIDVGPILLHLIERASELYDVSAPTLLNSVHYGAPQERKRLFVVGVHRRLNKQYLPPPKMYASPKTEAEKTLFDQMPVGMTTEQALDDLPDVDDYPMLLNADVITQSELGNRPAEYAARMRWDTIEPNDFSIPRPSWNPYVVDCCLRTTHDATAKVRIGNTPEGKQEGISGRTRLKREWPSHTLRAGTREGKGSHTAVRPLHYQHNRVITVREGARLMGFPDWMTFHRTKWHGFRLVGNGVPAPLGRAVADAIRRSLYGE